MEYWQNLSLENLTEEIEGIVYTEEWKPIAGYEELYEVSNFGRIKSLKYARKKQPGILKPQVLKTGYLRVELKITGNRFFVHRLVAQAFIPNPDNKPEVNHKWGITKDNRARSLEWFTKSEQQVHAQNVLGFRPKLPPMKNGKDNPVARAVKQIDKETGKILQTYPSIQEAELATGIGNSSITSAAKGRYHTAGGFKWEYI